LHPTKDTSKSLAIRILEGDTVAEAELVERYSNGLRLILLKRTGNPQLTQDLCQDTFVIALQKLRAGQLRNPEALGGFLRQIAINLSIEHFRKERRYVHQEDGIIALQTPHIERKAERIDRERVRAILDGALEELAQPRDREILKRFYLLDEDKSSICGALELSAAHFDRVLYRAKQRMHSLILQQPELKNLLFGSLIDG
jgi:RNA polymerase sigma-70 factor (ECF subfamily)